MITKPLGASCAQRYMVSQIRGAVLRFVRTDHHEHAASIAREWDSGNYVWTPGTRRKLNFCLTPPPTRNPAP